MTRQIGGKKTDIFFSAPPLRPFGLSVLRPTFSLQVSQKAVCACAQRSSQKGQEDLSQARSKGICFIGSKDSAMPGGPSFKFNSDQIRDLLPWRQWAGGGVGNVERRSDVFRVRI